MERHEPFFVGTHFGQVISQVIGITRLESLVGSGGPGMVTWMTACSS